MLQLIMLFSFITAMFLFYLLFKYILIKSNSITRLKRYINVEEIREERKKTSKRELKSTLSFVSRGIGSVKFLAGYKKTIQVQLIRAHLLLKAEEYISLCLILFLMAGIITFMLKHSPIFALIIAIIGWLTPSFILGAKIRKRIKNLNDQLGDAIVLISNSLKAGFSFFQAVDIVAKEMSGPIAEEFTLLQKEINLGLTTEKALENMANRVLSDDLELVITAVLIQRQAGGNLAEVLDNISSTIRDRVKIKGEVKTVTAQGRMSGWVISLLPVGLGLMIFLINPEHINVLFKNPLGIAILVVSALMELIGIYFINKIVKIEV